MAWLEAARARLRLLLAPGAAEARMDEEIRFHIEMETERLAREAGLDPVEARRRALVAFGGVEKVREEMRDGRGLAWLGGWKLDLKLGVRMLRRSPGLTVVATLALAVAIGGGAGYLELVNDLFRPRLAFPDGDRIVGLHNWDAAGGAADPRVLHDFAAWRRELRSVEELGAFRPLERNLVTADGRAEPVRGVETSAAAFRVTRVPPALGRPLVAADEAPGAPAV
ncbi:MAG TPA: permease prefix domain 1-containing protein, partial [Longimicrobium sp.]|nr:permease prefix domain 1-containing protein [Longimicrobium sp.]